MKRILCFLLIFVFLCSCVLPSFIVPARAVAVADDIALAVALLFSGYAGITFSRSDHAVQALQKFMQEQTEAAAQIVSIATNYVKDGVLSLVQEQKTMYAAIITALRGFFTTTADDSGALTGSLVTFNGIQPTYAETYNDVNANYRFSFYDGIVVTYAVGTDIYSKKAVYDNGQYVIYRCKNNGAYSNNQTLLYGRVWTTFDVIYRNDTGSTYIALKGYNSETLKETKTTIALTGDNAENPVYGATITIADNITYLQDLEVDGTSAIKEFQNLPDNQPDPDDDDKDVEVPVPIPLTPEIGTIQTGQGKDADGKPLTNPDGSPATNPDGSPITETNPALDPSKLIEELTKTIEQIKQGANPNPGTDPDNPNPDTPTEDDRGKRHDAEWKSLFPFCVPFDLIDFLGVLAADPVAPQFDWRFYVPNVCDETIHVDLSEFDTVAQICRTMELLAFCIGLILLTRNIIRG